MTVIASLVLVVGLIMLTYPFYTDYQQDKKTNGLMQEARANALGEEEEDEKQEQESQSEAAPEHDAPTETSETQTEETGSLQEEIQTAEYSEEEGVQGEIQIPGIALHLPIFPLATDEHLAGGATTVLSNQTMEEGNYPIAGHNMREDGLLFSDIVDLEEGDKIFTTDYQSIYTFVVSGKQEVNETETEVLDDRGKDEVTLITCHPDKTIREKRKIVRAQLQEEEPFTIKAWEGLEN